MTSNGHHPHVHMDFESPEMVEGAARDGEALIGFVERAAGILSDTAAELGLTITAILDLGCGPGVGSCRLAERLAPASVLAVDGSAAMLGAVSERAARFGLGERVTTRQVEMGSPDLESLGHFDAVWISMALHHIGDEQQALTRIHRLLEAGGLLALIETAGPPRIMFGEADPAPEGLWDRLDEAMESWFADMRASLPEAVESDSYPEMLARAGFELHYDGLMTLMLDASADPAVAILAVDYMRRTHLQLEAHADPDDLAALDRLINQLSEPSFEWPAGSEVYAIRQLYVAGAGSH